MSGGDRPRRDPWHALTALTATLCALSLIALRWLAILGVVREYTVAHTTGSLPPSTGGWSYSATHYTRGFGVGAGGASTLLTHFDHVAWVLGFAAGVLWMLRVARRSSGYRIGVVRTIAVVVGLGAFVVTGAMHRGADAVVEPGRRPRIQSCITWWCVAAVLGAVLVGLSAPIGGPTSPALGVHGAPAPLVLSIGRSAFQLVVVAGGSLIAVFLTARLATREISNGRVSLPSSSSIVASA